MTEIKSQKKSSTKTKSKQKIDDIDTKMKAIANEVHRILGVYERNTVVIDNKEDFVKYIDKSIANGIIAVDTETNNSTDELTCQLMGLCLYTPGERNAYIPINHVKRYEGSLDGERLSWQLTEADVKEQLDRLKPANTKVLCHNGKFDYKVIHETCDCSIQVYWDTFIASQLLDENELHHNLKYQYITKVDPSIEKYDIEGLFGGYPYAIFDPRLFALYAATDSYMTYKLYLWQLKQMELPENRRLLDNILYQTEMPTLKVAAGMELRGVCIDKEYAKELYKKYNKQLEAIQEEVNAELAKYDKEVCDWRETSEANQHEPKVEGLKPISHLKYLQLSADNKKNYSKSKNEQLQSPVSTTSPAQLSIFFYDILKQPEVYDKKKKAYTRPTGEDALKNIGLPICEKILKEREFSKLINTYIVKLPECVSKKDGRLHASFLQLGTQTGRFSSKDPNLQNIPSGNHEIRMMFVPTTTNGTRELIDDTLEMDYVEEIETTNGWKFAEDVKVGDVIQFTEDLDKYKMTVTNIDVNGKKYTLHLSEEGGA